MVKKLNPIIDTKIDHYENIIISSKEKKYKNLDENQNKIKEKVIAKIKFLFENVDQFIKYFKNCVFEIDKKI